MDTVPRRISAGRIILPVFGWITFHCHVQPAGCHTAQSLESWSQCLSSDFAVVSAQVIQDHLLSSHTATSTTAYQEKASEISDVRVFMIDTRWPRHDSCFCPYCFVPFVTISHILSVAEHVPVSATFFL